MNTLLCAPVLRLLRQLPGCFNPALERHLPRLFAAMEQGHVCLPLETIEDATALQNSSAVGGPDDYTPFVLDDALYVRRYWQLEVQLVTALRKRAATVPSNPPTLDLVQTHCKPLCLDEGQSAAVENATRRSFAIITGGPGTGKTRTAAAYLAVLTEHAANLGQTKRFALCAPTGKAAARLLESVTRTLRNAPLSEAARSLLPTTALTLHRLLGASRGDTTLRYNADHPLPAEVIVLDEGSMVALPMMARFLDALAPESQVLLLGDEHQLASVEAGHVLGDLCAARVLSDGVSTLKKNHRFATESRIHQLANAIVTGDTNSALSLLNAPGCDVDAAPCPTPRRLLDALREPVCKACAPWLKAQDAKTALAGMNRFRLLTPLRGGPYGVETLNRLCEDALSAEGLINPRGPHYHGRPILIRSNDATLRLYNGDVGVEWTGADGVLRAIFTDEESGQERIFHPARLPEHETSYAMTIHKAQGSEFQHVMLLLADAHSPIVSRELLYTAVTRARERLTVWWNPDALITSISRPVLRWSGLRKRLSA